MENHTEPQPKKLLDQLRDATRRKHYSIRTEEAYVSWVRQSIVFHHTRHLQEMGSREIETFLTHRAVDERVAASTQNQACYALLFLYREVLKIDFDGPIDAMRAKQPKRVEEHRIGGHFAVNPPSMTNADPVTKAASSEAR